MYQHLIEGCDPEHQLLISWMIASSEVHQPHTERDGEIMIIIFLEHYREYMYLLEWRVMQAGKVIQMTYMLRMQSITRAVPRQKYSNEICWKKYYHRRNQD